MHNSTVILGVSIVESLVVVVGNIFTIFVFWKHRNRLKRTSYLLVNLAVADLLAGLAEPIVITLTKIPWHLKELRTNTTSKNILRAFQTTFSFVSIFFLVLIALERAYALIWPLRHRVANIKGYIYCVIFTWVAGISVGVLALLAGYEILYIVPWMFTYCFIVLVCLVSICVSYLAIRTRLHYRVPVIDAAHNRHNGPEQNVKLSRTLFIVIAASLVCRLPSVVVHCVYVLCSKCVPITFVYTTTTFRLANSLVNPIIYCFRIPMFRETLARMKPRKQSKHYTVN
ncbi:adenosine receptor A2a-like [Oculina patagonica]